LGSGSGSGSGQGQRYRLRKVVKLRGRLRHGLLSHVGHSVSGCWWNIPYRMIGMMCHARGIILWHRLVRLFRLLVFWGFQREWLRTGAGAWGSASIGWGLLRCAASSSFGFTASSSSFGFAAASSSFGFAAASSSFGFAAASSSFGFRHGLGRTFPDVGRGTCEGRLECVLVGGERRRRRQSRRRG
jgi:hypothetical protein